MLSSHELSVRVQTLNRNSYQHPVNLAWEIGYTACSETTLSTMVLLNGFLLTDAILSPYEAGASLTDTINNEVLPALKKDIVGKRSCLNYCSVTHKHSKLNAVLKNNMK